MAIFIIEATVNNALAASNGSELSDSDIRLLARSASLPGENGKGKVVINKVDKANNAKLIKSLQGVEREKRTARYVCVLALAAPGKEPLLAEGTCEGLIDLKPKGSEGFGYDPYFYVPSFGKTMAELDLDEKNSISHRGAALRRLQELLL
mgnify:CR=1 FL=1